MVQQAPGLLHSVCRECMRARKTEQGYSNMIGEILAALEETFPEVANDASFQARAAIYHASGVL